MNDNSLNALNKLDEINNKLVCIISATSYIDMNICAFSDEDVAGFNSILRDLQNNVKEVKELLHNK